MSLIAKPHLTQESKHTNKLLFIQITQTRKWYQPSKLIVLLNIMNSDFMLSIKFTDNLFLKYL